MRACAPSCAVAELAGQSRHVQGVLAHNAAMQREATQLRTELGVARAAEQELAAKALACERTIQSLVGGRESWFSKGGRRAEPLGHHGSRTWPQRHAPRGPSLLAPPCSLPA